jgi:hypothetical protein
MLLLAVKKPLVFVLFASFALFCGFPLGALDLRFDVFSPQADVTYDTLHSRYSVSIDFFTAQVMDEKTRIGLRASPFQIQFPYQANTQWSFFPMEIIYNPVNYNELLWVTFYAGVKVMLWKIGRAHV